MKEHSDSEKPIENLEEKDNNQGNNKGKHSKIEMKNSEIEENKNDSQIDKEDETLNIIKKPVSLELLEAVFYAAGRPLTVHKLALEFGWKPAGIRTLVRKLEKKLVKTKGELKLLEVQRDRWVLHLPLDTDYPSTFKELINAFLLGGFPKREYHNSEAIKVLTSVAFHQPVSQAKLWKVLSTVTENESWLSIPKLQAILEDLNQQGLITANLKGSVQFKTTAAFASEWGFDSTRKNLKQQVLKRINPNASKKGQEEPAVIESVSIQQEV